MKREFKFINRTLALEMDASSEADGDYQKFPATFIESGIQRRGIFKLTKSAWEVVQKKLQEKQKPLAEVLVRGCIDALIAELYIRPIPEGFSYIIDHRFFENL
jgi:hypothetical protein